MASIRDVAKQAGVGVGTVSRALNGTGYVSPDTKRRLKKRLRSWDIRQMNLRGIYTGTGPVSWELWFRMRIVLFFLPGKAYRDGALPSGI